MGVNVEFQAADRSSCAAYVAHRSLLMQLWDLAIAYPNIASKIEVRIRRADPTRDYYYESSFVDAAIHVTLRWRDERAACEFLSCNSVYPSTSRCDPNDQRPRVFPSGDESTISACEPACYLARNARSANGEWMNPRERYEDDAFLRMSTTGVWSDERVSIDTNSSKEVPDAKYASQIAADTSINTTTTDMPFLEMSKKSGRCELGSAELLAFVTVPRERSAEHNVCRQDNFVIGDDVVAIDAGTFSGRHSKTYCEAFDKVFDPLTHTCDTSWLDKVLSYTFLGTAFVRLARQAWYGGDRCDGDFPATAGRPEVNVKSHLARYRYDRREWFDDVDSAWRLPPPNILLSDLGVTRLGETWSNISGLTAASSVNIENVDVNDSMARFDGREFARTVLQRERRDTFPPPPHNIESNDRNTNNDDDDDDDTQQFVDYDRVFETLTVPSNGSAADIISEITKELGLTATTVALEEMCKRVAKRAFDRTLRFVGQRLAGRVEKILISTGIRVTAARVTGLAVSRLSSRLLLLTSTAATGVGIVLTIAEIVGLVLDVMLLVGWDPGNYNSEFDNALYDDIARGWVNRRERSDTPTFDPSLVLAVYTRFSANETRTDGNDEGVLPEPDDSILPVAPKSSRFFISETSQAPWFFESFPQAVTALVRDFTEDDNNTNKRSDYAQPSVQRQEKLTPRPSVIGLRVNARDGRYRCRHRSRFRRSAHSEEDRDDDGDNLLVRVRPIAVDEPTLGGLLWSMQYLRARQYNAYGQYVDHENESTIRLTDATVAQNVRGNRDAALLHTVSTLSGTLPRETIVGAAQRNLLEKTVNCLLPILATIVFGVCGAAVVVIPVAAIARTEIGVLVALTILLFLAISGVAIVEIARTEYMSRSVYFDASTSKSARPMTTKAADVRLDAASDVSKICDLILASVNAIFERNGNDAISSTFAKKLIAGIRPELRVLLHQSSVTDDT